MCCVKDEFFLVFVVRKLPKRIFRNRTIHCLCFRCNAPLEGGIWSASPHVLRCMLHTLRQKSKHPPCTPSFTRSRVHVGDFENVERSLCLHLILGDMEGIDGQWVRMQDSQDSVSASCSWDALVESFLVMQRSKEPCISWFRLGCKSKGPIKIIGDLWWFELIWMILVLEVVNLFSRKPSTNHSAGPTHTGTWSRFDLFTLFVPFVRLGTPGSIHGGTTEGVKGHGLLKKAKRSQKCQEMHNLNRMFFKF